MLFMKSSKQSSNFNSSKTKFTSIQTKRSILNYVNPKKKNSRFLRKKVSVPVCVCKKNVGIYHHLAATIQVAYDFGKNGKF